LPQQEPPPQPNGQFPIGHAVSPQEAADAEEVQAAGCLQAAPAGFTNEKAMPADSRTAALSANTLFFMV